MKKYYIHNGTEQQGPFDIEDLRTHLIKQDTPIWYEGLSDWTIAGKVDELKKIFKVSTPPPFGVKQTIPTPPKEQTTKQTQNTSNQVQKKSKTNSTILIVAIFIIIVLVGLVILNNINHSGNNRNNKYDSGSYQEKVMTVEEIEQSKPMDFLCVDGTYNENFWGDKLKIQGKITNTATVASYKDAVVEVIFYSKTKTILGRENYTIYEIFPPYSENNFELKVANYENVNSIGLNVINAVVY